MNASKYIEIDELISNFRGSFIQHFKGLLTCRYQWCSQKGLLNKTLLNEILENLQNVSHTK